MKQIKFLALMIAVLTMTVSLQSCGEDEPVGKEYYDFYIECTSVSGGGMNAQECTSFKSELNSIIAYYTLTGQTKEEAISWFNDTMEELARELSSERPSDTIKITFALMTTSGTVVKKSTISVSSSGSSVN